jgi:hypothetical protein
MHVHSIGYDPRTRRLEVFYRWKHGSQYHPITPAMLQKVVAAEQIHPYSLNGSNSGGSPGGSAHGKEGHGLDA